MFAPRDGDGPAKWWLWVFLGPDTACFVMDPSRAGAMLARHAGIDESGQLTADDLSWATIWPWGNPTVADLQLRSW
jgi:transposase